MASSDMFQAKVQPSMLLSQHCGNMYAGNHLLLFKRAGGVDGRPLYHTHTHTHTHTLSLSLSLSNFPAPLSCSCPLFSLSRTRMPTLFLSAKRSQTGLDRPAQMRLNGQQPKSVSCICMAAQIHTQKLVPLLQPAIKQHQEDHQDLNRPENW